MFQEDHPEYSLFFSMFMSEMKDQNINCMCEESFTENEKCESEKSSSKLKKTAKKSGL